MRNTLTIRLPDDLAQWLKTTSRESGIPQGQIIRNHLEKARSSEKPFMRWVGVISGPRDLSTRKGYSRK
jgi:hypothetical protein